MLMLFAHSIPLSSVAKPKTEKSEGEKCQHTSKWFVIHKNVMKECSKVCFAGICLLIAFFLVSTKKQVFKDKINKIRKNFTTSIIYFAPQFGNIFCLIYNVR